MTSGGDDKFEMSNVGWIGDAPAAGDSGAVDSAAVTRFLDDLRALGEGPAPEPSPELAALLSGVPSLAVARRRRLKVARRVALSAAAVVAGTTLAAANHGLPGPAQRVVSNVVNDITPFHIDPPRPAPITPAPGTHAPTHVVPAPGSSSDDAPEPTGPASSSEGGDHHGGGAGSSENPDSTPSPGYSSGGGDGERESGSRTSTRSAERSYDRYEPTGGPSSPEPSEGVGSRTGGGGGD